MFQAVREAFGFGKTADPMQQVQPSDPRHAIPDIERAKIRNGIYLALTTERDDARAERDAAYIALREIVAAETPGSAPAAKRMARIAREALPEYADGDQIAA